MFPFSGHFLTSKHSLGALTVAATLAATGTVSAQAHPTGLLFGGSEKLLSVAPTLLKGTLPTSVDLTAQFPTPGDQGSLGSCVAWAVGYGLFSQQVGNSIGWGSTNVSGHRFSPAWIYNQIHVAKTADGGGAYFGDAFNLLQTKGGATLSQAPYTGAAYGYNVALPAYAAPDALHYKGAVWSAIPPNNVTQVKTYLSAGKAVVIGINVFPDFDNLSAANPIYDVETGVSRGGHALVLIGYDDAKQAFKLMNSWGTAWGLGGYGWISYGLVQHYGTYVMTGAPVIGNEVLNYNISLTGVAGYDLRSTADRVIPFNLDGSGKKSLIMYRPGAGAFYIQKSLGEAGFVNVYNSYINGKQSGINGFDMASANDVVIPLDFNGDGIGDLILARPGTGAAWILQGNGNGTFVTKKADFAGIAGFDLKSTADQILVTDYDGDGKDDLVLYRPGAGAIWIAHSNGNGTFTAVVAKFGGLNGFDLLSGADRILSLDFNGDKKKDLMLYRPGQGAVWMLQSVGNGTFTTVYSSVNAGIGGFDLHMAYDQVLVGDVNGDKFDDLILYRPGSGAGWVVKSNGNGTFTTTQASFLGFGSYDLKVLSDRAFVGDFNGDGRADLFLYRPGTGTIWMARGTAAGTFTYQWNSAAGVGGYDFRSTSDQVVIADQDGNGMSDMMVYRPGAGAFQTTWFAF